MSSQPITPTFLLQRYGMLAERVKPWPIERTVPSDTDDDAVIATALAARTDAIATGDSDFPVLHPYRGVQILNAVDTLRYVRTASLTECRTTKPYNAGPYFGAYHSLKEHRHSVKNPHESIEPEPGCSGI